MLMDIRVHAVPTVVLAWLAVGASWVGLGLLLRRPFRLAPPGLVGLFVAFWTGWAAVLAVLQLWHMALPVSPITQLALGLAGLVGLALERRQLWGLAVAGVRCAPGPLAVLALALIWMANRATGPAQFYDAGLYYLQAIGWNTAYPIVPGLGNLHGRLAFNSSYFLYAALVHVGPLVGKGLHLANGPLFFALLAQGVAGLAALATGTGPRQLAFWSALTLAPVLYLLFGSESSGALPILHLHGASPDEAIFAVGMALSSLLVLLVLEPPAPEAGAAGYLRAAAALLACAGVSVKLSFVAYAGVALLVIYGLALREARPRGLDGWLALLGPSGLCVIVVLGVWAVRGVILSGYPAYPSTLGAMPVPWRVPTALVLSEANWVRSWARQQDRHWTEVLGGAGWLQSWLTTMSPLLSRPIALTILAGMFALATLGALPRRGPLWRALLFLLPPAASAVFWFVTAPGFRFAGAAFWVLGLGLVICTVEGLGPRLAAGSPFAAVCLAVVAGLLLYVAPVRGPLLLVPPPGSEDGFWALPVAPTRPYTTASGLELALPATGDQCWATPLPCTPYPRPELRLREPGNLGGGFVLDPARAYVDIGGSELPPAVGAPGDLGVALPTGWYPYEPEPGVRWMQDEGVILLFTERLRRVMLTIELASILGPAGFVEAGRLHLSQDGMPLAPVELRVGEPASIVLELEPGFTVLRLRSAGGAYVPVEILAGNPDSRRLSLAFYEIEIRDEQ
ncbi:MAG: hypothetical protein OHK0015_11680 [Chloroflexi bacterium OHK40]